MGFYLGVTLGSTALALLAQFARARRAARPAQGRFCETPEYVLMALSLAPYFLTMGLRYAIGTDYFAVYWPAFGMVAEGQPGPVNEIGYRVLVRLILLVTQDSTWLFLTCALLIVGSTGAALWKFSDIPWISILLFAADRTFFMGMNVMRQYMALAVVIWAFPYIRSKCFWKYALVVMAASTLHTSMLMFLPLYLLVYIPLTPLFGGAVITVMFLLREPLAGVVHRIVSMTRFIKYYDHMADISPLYREKFLYLLVIAAVASILYRRCRSKPGFQFLYNLELLALFISFNRSVVIQADRISWNLEFFHLLLIPALISACKKKWQKGVVGAVCIGVCLWFCWYEIFHCGYHEVVPYRCVFFSEVRFG